MFPKRPSFLGICFCFLIFPLIGSGPLPRPVAGPGVSVDLWATSNSPLLSQGQESTPSLLGIVVLGSFSCCQQALEEAFAPQGLMWEVFTGTAHLADRCSFVARHSSVFQMGGCRRILRWDCFLSLLGASVGHTHGSVTSFPTLKSLSQLMWS